MSAINSYASFNGALGRFVTNNNNFGSSVVDTRAITMIGEATSLNDAAMVPSLLCIFGFDEALKFGFVIWALAKDARVEDPTFPTLLIDEEFSSVLIF